MILLQANKKDIQNIILEVENKKKGIETVVSQSILNEYGKAVFVITGKSFLRAVGLEAKSNPKKYHHVYEWDKVGQNKFRLFYLERIPAGTGKLSINIGFKDSKTTVPIPSQLQEPGKTGKMVQSKHIFAKKAEVMELGKPIIYRTRKNTPMLADGQIKFVAAGTLIKNLNPGGKEVKGSLNSFFELWFSTKANRAIDSSGLLRSMQDETALILNKRGAGANEVKQGIISLLQQYSKDEVII
jgi:hypothetical protein